MAVRDIAASLRRAKTVLHRRPATALHDDAPATQDLLVCGGGALNTRLMQRVQQLLPDTTVQPTDARGLPAMQVEAAAFAWLAMRWVHALPGNLQAVTGAVGPRILGAMYPA